MWAAPSVFPVDRKAAPLLRGWVRRLKEQGVRLHANHRWIGWSDDGALRFATDAGEVDVRANATVLAMGGGSWPQLGSDGAWVVPLQARGVDIAPLQSANCGFDVDWTPFCPAQCRRTIEAGDRALDRPGWTTAVAAGRVRGQRIWH